MLNKTFNFIKFGFKLIKQKLIKPFNKFNIAFSKPKLTPAKSIALILFLAFYGLSISFLVNIIEAQGTCSTQLTCSGTTLIDLAIDDKLGIGTAGSFAKLEIDIKDLTTIEGLHISREAAASHYSYLNIEDELGNPVFKVHESGKVGIGTAGPAYELDVVGTINASTDIKVNGASVLTSYTPDGYNPDNQPTASGRGEPTRDEIESWGDRYDTDTHGAISCAIYSTGFLNGGQVDCSSGTMTGGGWSCAAHPSAPVLSYPSGNGWYCWWGNNQSCTCHVRCCSVN